MSTDEKTTLSTETLEESTAAALQGSKAIAATTRAEEIVEMMDSRIDEFDDVLRSVMSKERFLRLALAAFRTNPKLMSCTKPSIVNALLNAAALGVEPNTPLGEAFLIPRKNKAGVLEANFQLGYKGLMALARRSGTIITIHADVVYEGDFYGTQHGSQPYLNHRPVKILEERGNILCYYAYAHLVGGGFQFVEMLPHEINARRERAPSSSSSSPWDTDYEAMAIKTVLIELCKFLPRNPALSLATERINEQQ